MHPLDNNIGAYIAPKLALVSATITAGAGNDGQAVAGEIIDRLEPGLPLKRSAQLILAGRTTIASGFKLNATVVVEHGDEEALGDAATFKTASGLELVHASAGDLTDHAFAKGINVDLSGTKRYVRAKVTYDLTRSGTDTVTAGAVWAFGGSETLPATVNVALT